MTIATAHTWAILRCANCKTLELAASLTDAGFEAWTPVTREVRHVGEQRTREEIAVPLMPGGYVFARADRLADLLDLSHSPSLLYQVWDSEQRRMVVKGHPAFRVFRGGDHRFIPDRDLEPLRRLELMPRPKRIERTFHVGERVRTDEAGFTGLNGTVLEVRGKTVVVSFGWLEPEIPTWAVRPLDESPQVHVNGGQPERDAAKAA